MTLIIQTARVSYGGPDRFDITRKSGGRDGRIFAPSWAILGPALDARKEAKREREDGEASAAWYAGKTTVRYGATEVRCQTPLSADRCEDIRRQANERAAAREREAWATYVQEYLGEMAASLEINPGAWKALLARERVVAVCYCADSERCHRSLLADLLATMGARYEGEIGKPPLKERVEAQLSLLGAK